MVDLETRDVTTALVDGRIEVISVTLVNPAGITGSAVRAIRWRELVGVSAYAHLGVPKLDRGASAQQVADAYKAALAVTSGPVRLLSELSGIPRPTIGRWVQQARGQGLIAAARRGRAQA